MNDIGQLVIRNDDDNDVPVFGRVTGWKDEDTCMVLWGDSRFYPVSVSNAPIPEPMDQLTVWLGQFNQWAVEAKPAGALWIEWDDESGSVLDDVLKLVKYILGEPDTVA